MYLGRYLPRYRGTYLARLILADWHDWEELRGW
jgi:hypothetical protein